MELQARVPDPLPNSQPMDKTWRMWKQEFNIYLRAAGFDKKLSEDKAICLQNRIGKVGLEAMQDIKFNKDDQLDFEILMSKFDDYFDPPKRELEERYKFYSRSKKNNESIEKYIADLKEKAKTCNFGDLTDSLIRDMVILDIKDKHLRQIMFEEKDLDLDRLTLVYRQYELSAEKMKEVTKKVTAENSEKSKDSNASSDNKKSNNICWRCGNSHPPKVCPAFKFTCDKCKEKGHFTHRCNKRNPSNIKNYNPNSNQNANKSKNYTKNPFSQIDSKKQ